MKELHLVCNAHLDPVWMWDWPEGASEAISTFYSAVELAEEFDYVFCHNEVLLYEFIEKFDPELFERIKKLENSGVIEGYTTVINQNAVGRELMAFMYVSLEHPKYNEGFVKQINENSSVVECHYIAGDFDFILKVVTKSGKSLEEFLNFVKSIGGVSLTRTSVVLSTNKYETCLLPDKKDAVSI